MTTPPPPWGAPTPAAPQWGAAAQPPPQWGGPQQEQASWGAPPPPQWGAPGATYGDPIGDPSGNPAPPPSNSVLGTVFGHLVLWLGLLTVAFAYRPIVRVLYETAHAPADLVTGVLGAVSVLPIAVASVIVARGATLRWVAVLGAVTLVVSAVVLNLVSFAGRAYLVPTAMGLLAFGTWVAVRRHARIGYLLLIPAVILVALWFGPTGFDLRAFPYRHGVVSSPPLLLWNDLPVVALAVLGLVSSLLRPKPSPDRDAVAFAVVGGLVVLTALAGVAAAFL